MQIGKPNKARKNVQISSVLTILSTCRLHIEIGHLDIILFLQVVLQIVQNGRSKYELIQVQVHLQRTLLTAPEISAMWQLSRQTKVRKSILPEKNSCILKKKQGLAVTQTPDLRCKESQPRYLYIKWEGI